MFYELREGVYINISQIIKMDAHGSQEGMWRIVMTDGIQIKSVPKETIADILNKELSYERKES